MKWKVINNFLSPQQANFLYQYVLLAVKRHEHLEKYHQKRFDENIYGTRTDGQVNGAFSLYGDLVFDTLLKEKLRDVESQFGKRLIENYSYVRVYQKGNELKRHRDRFSCEVSLTVCLGYDAQRPWPIYIDGDQIILEPGDALAYKGQDVEHWRETFDGNTQAQVFLHYNDIDSNTVKYDGRPELGLPGKYKNGHRNS